MNELLLNGIVVTTNIKSHTDYKELFPIEKYSLHLQGRRDVNVKEDYAFMAASENEPHYLLPHVLKIGKIERVGNKFDKEK